jgi:hypothetical protein
MAQRPANIESPEVIKELRNRFVTFDQTCRNALMGCSADVHGTREWLRTEQRLSLKVQLRKCEEALVTAKREYEQARWAADKGGRSSGVEEMRALEKARQRKEEVERKVAAVSKWSAVLDQTVTKMMGPCNALTILLDQRTPQAMARLDQMLDRLEEYFRPSPGGAP